MRQSLTSIWPTGPRRHRYRLGCLPRVTVTIRTSSAGRVYDPQAIYTDKSAVTIVFAGCNTPAELEPWGLPYHRPIPGSVAGRLRRPPSSHRKKLRRAARGAEHRISGPWVVNGVRSRRGDASCLGIDPEQLCRRAA